MWGKGQDDSKIFGLSNWISLTECHSVKQGILEGMLMSLVLSQRSLHDIKVRIHELAEYEEKI